MRHYIHFNSDVFSTLGRAVPTPSANARSDPTTAAAALSLHAVVFGAHASTKRW